MTLYHILLFFHILGVIFWIGSGMMLQLLGWRADLSGKREQVAEVVSISEWIAPRVFMPSALGTLIFGILLVIVGKPSFSDLWVIIALIGFLVTALLSGAFIGRTSQQLSLLLKKNREDKRIDILYPRIVFISRINFAILFIIIFDMVIKPKSTDISFFIVSILFFLIVAGWSWYQKQGKL